MILLGWENTFLCEGEGKTTISMLDFPTWFNTSCYGGLACCICAIIANTLYTIMRKRGTNHQLSGVLIACVLAALLLLPAIYWYNFRYPLIQKVVPFLEIVLLLGYITFCGWLLPLGATLVYWLFARPQMSASAIRTVAAQSQHNPPATMAWLPPRYQQGMLIPFVFGEEIPWGWLEYRSGNFQGQRLELKRCIISLGRDEDCDIWIDDEMASRRHAELAWCQGQAYLTDCDSLNGILLNGQRVRGFVQVSMNDVIEVGEQRFVFLLADQQAVPSDESDPLAHHKWRSALEEPGTEQFIAPPFTDPISGTGPTPLKLPMRQKQ